MGTVTEAGTRGDAVGAAPGSGPGDDEWIEAFRRATQAQREIFERHRGIAARTEYEGIGEGGDRTLVIDRLCEDAIFAELERLHQRGHDFTAISEERGTVRFGSSDSPVRVVADPIDGSLNARRTIPWHSVSIAVADGDSMADVRLGYVYEFGAGEEFVGSAGGGATLDGERISVPEGDGLEVLGVEATKPERVLAAAESLQGRVYRMRTPGSIAISLCYVAAGRFDAMMSTRNCRSVDAAAAQLIATEAGAQVEFAGLEPGGASLDLSARYDVAAARTPADLRTVREAQDRVP
jgi:myo-inositol-1(or 4)-monophosphatase